MRGSWGDEGLASILSISSMNLTEEESQVMVSSDPQQPGSCNIQTMKLETTQHNATLESSDLHSVLRLSLR